MGFYVNYAENAFMWTICTDNDYLKAVLDSQVLGEDDEETKKLRNKREEVEGVIRAEFGDAPSIRYGGSYKKRTMIRESYDLDLLCYFGREDTTGGGTLEEIYKNVQQALANNFSVEPKRSAIRLWSIDHATDFSVDVVPGRFASDSKDDVYLHQTGGGKKHFKTNPEKHVIHVRDSGHRDVISLTKLWRVRFNLSVKTFVLELAVIGALDGFREKSIRARLTQVLAEFRDNIYALKVEDPANPTGNDLSELWSYVVRTALSDTAELYLARKIPMFLTDLVL